MCLQRARVTLACGDLCGRATSRRRSPSEAAARPAAPLRASPRLVPASHAAPRRRRTLPCGSAACPPGASRPRTCRSAGGRCRARPERGRGCSIRSQSSLPGIATLAASGASGREVDRELTSRTASRSAAATARKQPCLQGLPMELAGLEPPTSWVRCARLASRRSGSWRTLTNCLTSSPPAPHRQGPLGHRFRRLAPFRSMGGAGLEPATSCL